MDLTFIDTPHSRALMAGRNNFVSVAEISAYRLRQCFLLIALDLSLTIFVGFRFEAIGSKLERSDCNILSIFSNLAIIYDTQKKVQYTSLNGTMYRF